MVFPVKKLISLTAAALLSLTLLLPAAADTSSAQSVHDRQRREFLYRYL